MGTVIKALWMPILKMEEIKIKRRNTFKLIVSLLLIFQMLLPMELIYAVEANRTSSNDIFKEAVISLNGSEISADRLTNVNIGDEIHVSYDWTLPDGFDTSEELRIQPIPSNIKAFRDLVGKELNIFDEADVIGSFEFLEGEIRVKFREDFQVLEEKHGNLEFKFKLSEDDFKDDNLIDLDFGKEYPIRLDDKQEGGEIEKSGKLSEDGKSIHWEVEINKNYMNLGQVTIEDPIPEGLKLDGKVELYKINKKGEILGEPESYEAFPIELDNLVRPYRLSYSTKIEDGFSTKKDFKNTINIKSQDIDKSSEAVVELNTSDNIEKTGRKVTIDSKDYIEWTLKVNKFELDYENLIIEDIFGSEADQELVEDSIKIEPESPLKKLEKKDGAFSLELGKTDQTHSISYRTELKNLKMEPGQSQEISNRLKVRDGDRENTEIETEGSVDYHREKLVEKHGSVVMDYENKEKYIKWEVTVNKAGEDLAQGTIIKDQDIKLEGQEVLELKEGSLKLVDQAGKELVEDQDYELVKGSQGLWEIKLLRDFNETLKIQYGTATAPNREYYGNKVAIDLSGNGEIDDSTEASVDARSFNDRISKELPDYDFQNKTASWEVKLSSESGNFTSVSIEDVMTPNLSYIKGSMEADLDGRKLIKGEDYSLGLNEAGNLVLELTDKGLAKADKDKNSELTLLYKTDFDPDKTDFDSDLFDGKRDIENTAYGRFTTEKDPEERELNDWIKKDLEEWIRENAKKEGSMDQENRRINWQVYLNPQESKKASLNYRDELGPGQTYRKDSLRLYKYSFKGQSTEAIKGQLLEEGKDYSLEFSQDGKSFDLKLMENGQRIMLEYETDMIDRSEQYYSNTISPKDSGKDKEYKDEIYFEDWDKFLDKKAMFELDSVYPQDELVWELEVNRSYSQLKDVKIVDSLAGGHEYLEGSLKILDSKGRDYKDYSLELKDGKLIIDLGDIDSFYRISYSSFVTADGETLKELSNIAQLESGEELISKDEKFETVEISSIGGGVGTGILRGSLELTKLDQDGSTIENNPAEFKLYKILSNGKRIEMKNPKAFTDDEYLFRTDDSGLLKIERLSAARYILVETKAPVGYSLSEEEIEFEISREKKVFKKDFVNEKEKYGYIRIEKVDSLDPDLFLEGAEFEVINSKGERVSKLVTDREGRASAKLGLGDYKLVEIKAPAGYKNTGEVIEFTVVEGELKDSRLLKIENKREEGSLEIIKKDQETGIVLEGASFEIFKEDGESLGIIRTDREGRASKKLPYANYSLKEVEAPEGYVLDSQPREFKINSENREISLSIENKRAKGQLEIEKVDSLDPDLFLKGAEFEVINSKGEKVTSLKTDKDGRASLELETASYLIKEIKAPAGYKLKAEAIEVEIEEGLTTSISVENEKVEEPGKKPEEPGKETEDPGPEEPGKEPEEPGKEPEEAGKEPEEAKEEEKPADQLPKTGLADSRAYSILGVLLLICGLYIIKKSRIN